MILLIDKWDEQAARLSDSLKAAGYAFDIAVFQYDGFGSEDVTSPYEYFIYDGQIPKERNPVYFDKLEIPDFFEIESSNTNGEIRDYEKLRGKMFYAEPKNDRYIKIVDWMDGDGNVCCSDHYNRFGHRFAQTVFSSKKKMVHKTYYKPDGREVITENLLTGDIILTWHGHDLFFPSKTEFILYYLRQAYDRIDRILYNSLSYPFFVTAQYCRQVEKLDQNVLFWQEPIGDDIPGNMKGILQDNLAGTSLIAVQQKDAFANLMKLSVDKTRFERLGFIYPRLRENSYSRNILVFTNSDQIEQLETLACQLPDARIHIGALTEMSPKLLQMIKYENIQLYPTITKKQIQFLWEKCDIYLDINHGGEILDAVETAFKHRELILGFANTLHKKELLADKNIFSPDEAGATSMAALIKDVISDPKRMDEELEIQWNNANAETVERYRQLMK